MNLPSTGIDLKAFIEHVESKFIRQALQVSNNVVTSAAKLLNLKATTLVGKMRKYKMERNSCGRPAREQNSELG